MIVGMNELIESLEWFIENDDTNNTINNGYWIEGLEQARKVVAIAKGEVYERGEWLIDKPEERE